MKFKAVAVLLILSLPSLAQGWGGEGHQIVALIAEDRLTPAAKDAIHNLLGKDVNISDGDVASWADEVRRSRGETAGWHYVDIPVTAETFDEQRDGRNHSNVIDAINNQIGILMNKNAKKLDEQEALKFLVHFVGDMHQPLHCAERNGDRGGNSRLVFFLDQPKALNLHSVWDGAILNADKETMTTLAYAEKLNAAIKAEDAAEWEKGNPTLWANESHKLAIDVAYKGVATDGPPPKLDQKYVDAGKLVVEKQLQRGGVRLAWILNKIYKTS